MTPNEIEQKLDDIKTQGVNLSVWETDFIESIEVQFKIAKKLSPKQEEILEKIYACRTN